jgi:4-hydroxybenzoyl-CoA thioesterase
MLVSRRDVEISWGDCDPADIVYFPNYFRWFDASTAHHFATAGLPKPELIRRYNVVGFPMVDTSAKFHVPSKHGDVVNIRTRITRFGRSSFDLEHRLFRGKTLAVEGFEKRVLVQKKENGDGIRSFAIPKEVIALFED